MAACIVTAAVMSHHECQCQTRKMQTRYAYNSRRIPYSFCLFPFISLPFLQHFAKMSKLPQKNLIRIAKQM